MASPQIRPPTIADIAKHLGVSKSTVSVALRGKIGVSKSKAARIVAEAEKMGYRRDPLIGLHMARVRNRQLPRYQATLAWIDNRIQPLPPPIIDAFEGAVAEAERQGYRLEEFRIRDEEFLPNVLNRVLITRNITGLLLAPQPKDPPPFALDWNRFSVVGVGNTFGLPSFHLVANHHMQTGQLLMKKLREMGFQRIGTIIDEDINFRVKQAHSAIMWNDYHRQRPEHRVEPFIGQPSIRPFRVEEFIEWFLKQKPDVIVVEGPQQIAIEGIKRLRLKLGRDVALASRAVHPGDSSLAGMDQCGSEIGAAAAAHLIAMLHRGEVGIPESPKHLLLEGKWQSGESLQEPTAKIEKTILCTRSSRDHNRKLDAQQGTLPPAEVP